METNDGESILTFLTAIRKMLNMTTNRILHFLAFLFLFQCSCVNDGNSDATSFENNHLVGRWEIVDAFRNGKKIETLTDTFYEFDGDGNMSTNLTPSVTTENYGYNFNGKEIQQKGGEETVFKVEELSDSSLTISMMIYKYPFKLVLAKAEKADEAKPIEQGILQ